MPKREVVDYHDSFPMGFETIEEVVVHEFAHAIMIASLWDLKRIGLTYVGQTYIAIMIASLWDLKRS